MKRLALLILISLSFYTGNAQYKYFGTRSYTLCTLPEFYVLSTSTSSAFLRYSLPTNGGSVIRETGVLASSGTIPTISNYTSKSIFATRTLPIALGAYIAGFLYNLSPSTTYFTRAYAINESGVVYSSYTTFTTSSGIGLPTVTTDYAQNVTTTSVDVQGYAVNSAGGTISDKGFCWNLTGSPTKAGSYASVGSGNGTFNTTISSLASNTTYFVAAYATNESGVAYAPHIQFTTASTCASATLTTTAISGVSYSYASSGGNISSSGGCTVTARGVCWSTSANPTIANSYTTDGSGTGTFSSAITGLSCGITYYARAYATTSFGTSYGQQEVFVTENKTYPALIDFSGVSSTKFTANCSISNPCGLTITSRGIVWADHTGPVWGVDNVQYCGSGAGTYSCTPYQTLTANTTYYVKAFSIINGSLFYFSEEYEVSTNEVCVSVGDYYGGGVVAYVYQLGDPGYKPGECHGIIAALDDMQDAEWGYYLKYLGVTGYTLGLGAANTYYAANDETTEVTDAVSLCFDLVVDEYHDWWLPSKDELNKLYINRSDIGNFNTTTPITPYWSSSEYNENPTQMYCWSQRFDTGEQTYSNAKNNIFKVRPIRYF
jgi:hypothetical protein